jgi:hypothetical protein
MSVQLFVVDKGAITYSVLRLCGGYAGVPRIAIGWSKRLVITWDMPVAAASH